MAEEIVWVARNKQTQLFAGYHDSRKNHRGRPLPFWQRELKNAQSFDRDYQARQFTDIHFSNFEPFKIEILKVRINTETQAVTLVETEGES